MFGKFFLVPFSATREAVVPHANDPIILGRLLQWFRHPEHQNPSIIYDFIGSSTKHISMGLDDKNCGNKRILRGFLLFPLKILKIPP